MKKKGQSQTILSGIIIAMLVGSMIIVGFITIPDKTDDLNGQKGFWNVHGYSFENNSLDDIEESQETALAVRNVVCDVNPESSQNCDEINARSIVNTDTGVGTTRNNLFQTATGAITTVLKSGGIAKVMLENSGRIFGLDPFIITTLVTLVLFSLGIAIAVLLIRSGIL